MVLDHDARISDLLVDGRAAVAQHALEVRDALDAQRHHQHVGHEVVVRIVLDSPILQHEGLDGQHDVVVVELGLGVVGGGRVRGRVAVRVQHQYLVVVVEARKRLRPHRGGERVVGAGALQARDRERVGHLEHHDVERGVAKHVVVAAPLKRYVGHAPRHLHC